MFHLIASIAVYQGKVVRLQQGDFESATVYDKSPLDVAMRFEQMGLTHIQLLDLDGAQRGDPLHYHILEMIRGYTKLHIDFSGGISTHGAAGKAFECGADTITVGTVAVNHPDIFADWLITYGREKIILSADAINGKVAIHGWQRETELDLYSHIEYNYMRGLKYVKTTDITRDGTLEGPAFDLYKDILWKYPDLALLASGGVRNMSDIEKLQEMGLHGVIFGKAFYENMLSETDLTNFVKASV